MSEMRIAIVHNQVGEDASEADRDVLVQAEAVSEAAVRLGHEPVSLDATLNLEDLRRRLSDARPDVVFNLVESLDGSDWMAIAATSLFDAMELPYTGSPTESLLLSNHKASAKQRLRESGLPTPDWFADSTAARGRQPSGTAIFAVGLGSRYIVKAVAEHASVGMGDDCIVAPQDENELRHLIHEHSERLGCPCFAERYVAGREFNLALLASAEGPEVLPPAEIDFSAFPADKPRIVGYRAKWDEGSFEYHHTPRRLEFDEADGPLLAELGYLAKACWERFDLRGYARVDFRVDEQRRPWILEINANPCLSPDAGFAAALARASIPFDQAVQRILDDSLPSRLTPEASRASEYCQPARPAGDSD